MAREIGLSRLTVFPVTKNDATGATFGTATPVSWVTNVSVSKTIAEYSAYADNIAEISSSKENGAELTITVSSDMSPKLEAQLTGKKYNNASMVSTADDTKPSFAIAYETVMSDGSVRRYCYYSCTISKNDQENETISDSVTAQTYELSVKAVPLVQTKELMIEMDEKEVTEFLADAANAANHDKVREAWEKFFETVPTQVV